ncbi:MAG: T9SS type A sorting domain-containing protein [Bacteroidia bacterium]
MKHFPRYILSFAIVMVFTSVSAQTLRQVSISVGNATEESAIREVIRQIFPLVDRTGSDLQLQYDITSPGGRHFTYTQTWAGIPVYGAGIKVNLVPADRITSFLQTLQDFTPPTLTTFSYPEENLLLRVGEAGAYDATIDPVFVIQSGQLHPAWKVITFSNGPVSSEEILFDANTGTEIIRSDRGAYFSRAFAGDTTGRAKVFIPNPCTRGNVKYGDTFTDNDDATSPALEALMDTVVLRDITWDDPVFRLQGPYVNISDRAPYYYTPATSASGDFFFGRDQKQFEDVMVYYHVDTFQRYVQSLGFTNLQNSPLEIDPHGKSNSDQSVFISNGGNSYILFGDGGVDDAEDADVIIHEYTHALSSAASPETNSGTERRGLDEGLGDYAAAIYSMGLNPNYGWGDIFNWDGHNEFWAGRTVISNQTYPPMSTSIYSYGELWASTLIKIRNEIGGTITDRLMLQEMYSNYSQMSLPEAARLFLQADTALYGGVHSEMIIFQFCQTGILSGATCLSVGVEEAFSEETISIYPNPGTEYGALNLNWNQHRDGETGYLEIYNMLGQQVYAATFGAAPQYEFYPRIASGFYQVQIRLGGKIVFSKKWAVNPE